MRKKGNVLEKEGLIITSFDKFMRPSERRQSSFWTKQFPMLNDKNWRLLKRNREVLAILDGLFGNGKTVIEEDDVTIRVVKQTGDKGTVGKQTRCY